MGSPSRTVFLDLPAEHVVHVDGLVEIGEAAARGSARGSPVAADAGTCATDSRVTFDVAVTEFAGGSASLGRAQRERALAARR